MTDKGFNISDLLISKGSQLFQPFQREKNNFQRKTARRHRKLQKPEYTTSSCPIMNQNETVSVVYLFVFDYRTPK